ncbi:FG-GAP repeat protein [Grimontia sp. NTOU-MAR1]|uniref:FG-GAP repeat protein n=1 Tax=Grimontia sp. NTOU-MAR1 TaxID=3111011 RepID=UPI002DB8A9C3|nr:FG-GAP repeat protein [Grimontia sp. NTOU-MAR1]WRV98857.1 FG-GAP repeat protein [Grimontia sp. NTOU-MAR1]
MMTVQSWAKRLTQPLTLSLGPLKNHLAEFFVLAENSTDKTPSGYESLTSSDLTTLITYIKASDPSTSDQFGWAVSVSEDGNTLAVGGIAEDSNADLTNATGESNSGAVYVYRFASGRWSEEAIIKASNAGAGDQFGTSVSLSSNGNTLAVGTRYEDSNADGSSATGADNSGAVYVYRFASGRWSEEAFIKASNTGAGDYFGWAVTVSGDGNTLAVGAYAEDSNADGSSATGADNSGAVYVYRFDSNNWSEEAFIKASNAGASDYFGWAVSLSSNGNTLAVGAYAEDSNADGSNDTGETDSGAVYVYRFDSNNWSEEAFIKASNTGASDYFGHSVSLSSNGNALAVGAYGEDSNADLTNATGENASGAVYVYRFASGRWSEEAFIKASNAGASDYFGYSVSLSSNGNTLAVGARSERSTDTGINGDGNNDDAPSNRGAAYVYRFDFNKWSQEAYIKAKYNTHTGDYYFGRSVSVAGNGNTLAVGARYEDSGATGINGDGNIGGGGDTGAVYVF